MCMLRTNKVSDIEIILLTSHMHVHRETGKTLKMHLLFHAIPKRSEFILIWQQLCAETSYILQMPILFVERIVMNILHIQFTLEYHYYKHYFLAIVNQGNMNVLIYYSRKFRYKYSPNFMNTFSIEVSGTTNNNINKIIINLKIYLFFHQNIPFKVLKPTDLLSPFSISSDTLNLFQLNLAYISFTYHFTSFKRTYDMRHAFRTFFSMSLKHLKLRLTHHLT